MHVCVAGVTRTPYAAVGLQNRDGELIRKTAEQCLLVT